MTQKTGLRAASLFSCRKNSAFHSGIKCSQYSAILGCEARVGLTTSSLTVGLIARMETEEDLLAAIPIRPDAANNNSLSQTDGVANQIQVTNDETPAYDMTDRVLPPVGCKGTSVQDTGDIVTSRPMTTESLDIPTKPSPPQQHHLPTILKDSFLLEY
ncbi:integrase core domain protein [Plakobranchus ocellatus]|uniref:Integrase core domain protein n=1 Tax=Plakobranchus ocellatus TaxID=259542 RepID=A0AAV4CBW3_9GAST|nr:integrase core domain protein [Plakobranchus ocellatus]